MKHGKWQFGGNGMLWVLVGRNPTLPAADMGWCLFEDFSFLFFCSTTGVVYIAEKKNEDSGLPL